MIHPDFESIIVPEDNGMQNPKECDQIKKHYQLLYVHDKFSEPFKSYLDEDVA